jgi:undecaprenyl-diphosphatase
VTIGTGLGLLAVGERRLGSAALLALSLSHLVVRVLKRAVARPRPCDATGRPLALVDLPDPFSFPSGHAASAMAMAVTLAWGEPSLTPVLLAVAVLVCASRVTLRVHHVGDVIAGAAIGVAGAMVAVHLLL